MAGWGQDGGVTQMVLGGDGTLYLLYQAGHVWSLQQVSGSTWELLDLSSQQIAASGNHGPRMLTVLTI